MKGITMKTNENCMEKIVSSVPEYDLDGHTVVVFGAGKTSVLYQKCFEREGIRPVYYVDNSEAKQGTVFQGVPVISVEKLVSLRHTFGKPVLVLICSFQISACNQIQSQLQKCGLTYMMVDAYVFRKNKQLIKEVYDLLEDDFSRNVYIGLIQSRVNNTQVSESIVSNEQYFILPQFLECSEKEVFVDSGAYVGDTLEQYINKKSGFFDRIYAFEPEYANFSALNCRSLRLKKEWGFSDDKLTLIYGGVGAKTEQKLFSSQISTSARMGANFMTDHTENAKEVMVYAFDDYFKEQYVGFIKADIESYELDMLQGAESVIKRDKPLLAVSIYHNASDMFTIPLFIKNLCGQYIFKIRHHKYKFDDTVLYAYV
jgi:FkbM family methyltransferase